MRFRNRFSAREAISLAVELPPPASTCSTSVISVPSGKAGSSPSLQYSGDGETLGFFFLFKPGQVDEVRLAAFARHDWFRRIPPKVLSAAPPLPDLRGLDPADARATLVAGVVAAVVLGFEHFPQPPSRLIVTGAGAGHGAVLAMLGAGCDCPVDTLTGHDPAAVPVWALAFLAARVAMGLPTTGPRTTGVAAPVGGGTLHRP